jgi:dihydropteroate synthase
MANYEIEKIHINTLSDAKNEIRYIGSDPESIDIMAPKAISRTIKVKNVILQDAIIIKQDMLSIGGEVAVPKKTFELHDKTGDILIIGNLSQMKILIEKLKRHYNRIKIIAQELENILIDEL